MHHISNKLVFAKVGVAFLVSFSSDLRLSIISGVLTTKNSFLPWLIIFYVYSSCAVILLRRNNAEIFRIAYSVLLSLTSSKNVLWFSLSHVLVQRKHRSVVLTSQRHALLCRIKACFWMFTYICDLRCVETWEVILNNVFESSSNTYFIIDKVC